MAASFADLTARLNLNIQNFADNLQVASGLVDSFSSKMSATIDKGMAEPAKKSRFAFKDISRIVSGILISQAFYSGLRSIKEVNSAVLELTMTLERSKLLYATLFQDTPLAKEFVSVLQDYSTQTIFGFKEIEKVARQLSAFGINYQNIMYVTQGIVSTASAAGDPQKLKSISRALGQIHAKGRLYNEEVRQLSEAGVPVYEILREKLGATTEELRNLRKNALPAHVAINAIVDGMNEKFGGAVETSMLTMEGLFSRLKANLLMLSAEATQPLMHRLRALLIPVVDFTTKIKEIVEKGGVGALFENLIPQKWQAPIRAFIANIMNLFAVLKKNIKLLFKEFKIVFETLLRLFNMLLPIFINILLFLEKVRRAILDNEKAVRFLIRALTMATALWVLFKIKALGTVVVVKVMDLLSKATLFFSKVLSFVVAHPFWTLLITAAVLLVGLSTGFTKLGNAVNDFFKKLTKIGGVDPDKLLLPSQKERTADLEKFNKRLRGTGDIMDELADSTGKAVKAAHGLLAFDEVFKLKQPSDGSDTSLIDWGEFDFPDLSDAFIPDMELPDFDDFASDLVGNLLEALGGKKAVLSAGIGAIIGAVLGGIIGGPAGIKIGAIAGTFAGWFWPTLAEKLKLTDVGIIALPIAASIGTAIGFIAGGPLGAVVGAGIGTLVGWIIDGITRAIKDGDYTGLAQSLCVAICTSIGFVVGGPAGAAIGAAIGLLVAWIIGKIEKGISTGDWKGTATAICTLIGGAIGLIVGGPLGGVLGAAIGALVGWFTEDFIKRIKENKMDHTRLAVTIATVLGAIIGGIAFGPLGAVIGAAVGGLVSWIVSLIIDAWKRNKKRITDGISKTIDKIKSTFGFSSSLNVSIGAPGAGHATGGVFNREHVAKFAEDNKAEAVIPLENASAMKPFVDAISSGILQGILPAVASSRSSSDTDSLRPLFVGTLVADEHGLKELSRKMRIIELTENNRRG